MRISSLLLFLTLPLTAADSQLGTSTVAVGAGATFPAGELAGSYPRGPSITGEYEFGLHRFLAATVGVENFFLDVIQDSRYGPVRERFTLVPFGLRGILPVGGGCAELFAGTGGARLWSTDSTFGGHQNSTKLLWQANGGLRVKLDRAGRFRLGPVVRLNRDLGRPTQVWLLVTGELSYRFGR